MSLSQKDPGKVLVPWFNLAEWNSVRELIYTENDKNWPKALKILQIWKARTPLLSSGVEGTLIALEALSVDKEKLTNYEVTNIYATAIVRFLNLSAANDSKQGTFFKKAQKNNLPKWLISLRHDIAHSHKLPSLFMLDYGLKFCLDWIKEKYWDVQLEQMEDFEAHDRELIEDVVYAYIHLNFQLFYKPEIKHVIGELKSRINNFIENSNHRKIRNNENVLKLIQDYLDEVFADNAETAVNYACSLLVDDRLILSTHHTIDDSGNKRIPNGFCLKWQYLIGLFYESGKLDNLICKLFEFTCSNNNNDSYSEIASLWIYEIFQGLLNREQTNDNCLHFSSDFDNRFNADKFMNIVLNTPNKFTLNYLYEVLVFNKMSKEFIEDSRKLVKAFVQPSPMDYSDNILTINDLNIPLPINFDRLDVTEKMDCSSHKWHRVKDTSIYKDCPLGILPHQSKNKNPLLDI